MNDDKLNAIRKRVEDAEYKAQEERLNAALAAIQAVGIHLNKHQEDAVWRALEKIL